MDPTIAATIIGVLLTFAFGSFATAFAWLRADTNARLDKVDARFDKMEEKADARFHRLEAKVDGLILGLTLGGFLTDPEESPADT